MTPTISAIARIVTLFLFLPYLIARFVGENAIFFFYLVCETIGTAATPGLLCQPRVIVKMIVESRWNVDW
jgi:hypothetical protein